jgi:hypothetical protein
MTEIDNSFFHIRLEVPLTLSGATANAVVDPSNLLKVFVGFKHSGSIIKEF